MSESTTVSGGDELRHVPLSRIVVADGFNPRRRFDEQALEALAQSLRERGCLQPIRVSATPQGEFLLVSGERRLRAAMIAGLQELPAIVCDPDQPTEGELEAELLVDAIVENVARVDLDPVEEAHACRRLRDAGLTTKGVAGKLGWTQQRVKDRLAILKVPEALHERVADGRVPLAAVSALSRLAAVHIELPAIAVDAVGQRSAPWGVPTTWQQVIDDPIDVCVGESEGDPQRLPAGVFDASAGNLIGRFTLDEQARERLEELCDLVGWPVEEFVVRFDRDAIDKAIALGAGHHGQSGSATLIVGDDVASHLAADYIDRCLKIQREHAEAVKVAPQARTAAPADASTEPVDDAELRRAEREAALQAKRAAVEHNTQLGIAALRSLARVKVDARVIRVLTAFTVGSDAVTLAKRGARYCLPNWPIEEQRKNGSVKVSYLEGADLEDRAKEFLAGASTPAEHAGRVIALIALARYADERCTAQSNRAYHEPTPGRALPWSADAIAELDELCAQALPEHLTAARKTA